MKTDKRELILDTAEHLMTCISDNDISVSMIAKEAGIGKGSVYYYFQSKEEILYSVVERAYKKALHEYFDNIDPSLPVLIKIRELFFGIIRSQFQDSRKNLIRTLHLNENLVLHNYLKHVAISEISPVLEKLLCEGIKEKTIFTETPREAAEMIVAVLTFILDGTVFTDERSTYNKLKLFANVLDTCLMTEKGSFNFLTDIKLLRS